jgi:hypothetical protein
MTDAPRRIQRSRAKGWRMPEGAVYVGRPSKWGNPWVIRQGAWWMVEGPGLHPPVRCGNREGAQLKAVAFFREAIRRPIKSGHWLDFAPGEVVHLRGKNLACWCTLDQPCHADVLLELANAPLRCEAVDG